MMPRNIITRHQPVKSVLSALSKTDLDILKNKMFGTETAFVRPIHKQSMLNKTENELQEMLLGMAVETSGDVKLYKTPNNYMNKLEKPEQPSLVFINGVFAFSGYPYSIELTPNKLQDLDFDIVTKCRFFEANEGTVLRVFNVNGDWYTITNKKLDAFSSKWAAKTKTFGCHLAKSIFVLLNPDHDGDTPNFNDVTVAKEYVNQIWDASLDPTKRYFFLLKSSNEERIVCDADEAILNIGVIDKNNHLSLDEFVNLTDAFQQNVVVPTPVEHKISTLEDLIEKINNTNPTKCSGLLAIFKTDFSGTNIENDIEQHFHVKLLNPEYKYKYSLRGNAPSLRFRLLQLRHLTNREIQTNPPVQPSYVTDFKQLYYPQCEDMLKICWTVTEYVFQKYQSIHVKRTGAYDNIQPKMEKVLNIIHNEYLISREITTQQKISDILSYIEPEILNQLIKEYESELKKQNITKTD